MKMIEVCRGVGLDMGTFAVLKNLEKLGVISIEEIRSYGEMEFYDSMEDMEKSFEFFEIVIERPGDNPIDGFSAHDFVKRMLIGLGIDVEYERVKE